MYKSKVLVGLIVLAYILFVVFQFSGNEVIAEYLTQNELGLAYEHLEYVISEVELSLNSEQTKKMIFIAEKLGMKK